MKTILLAGAATLALATASFADITINDAYARSSRPKAPTGAAFMVIENTGPTDDRLVEARSDVAARVELHTHVDLGGGVMRMTKVEEGFVIPAGGSHALARGGDHVMMMGLKSPLVQGETIAVTLVFEKAGEMTVKIPVDLERQDGHGMKMQGGHKMTGDGS